MVVINNNAAGVGFNDSTAVSPVGGNSGTTIGEQRLIAFQYAANIWGAKISSAVPIRISAQFSPLSCSSFAAILGSAGPVSYSRDFVGAPVASTWYPYSLANALYGSDVDPSSDDIDAIFNSNIGTTGCLDSGGWYYGLDATPPVGKTDFVTTLVHELGHGLGFATIVNLATGAKALNYNDTFMRNLEHHGSVPSDYPSMTNGQRVAASTATGNLHWVGANVRAASGVLTIGVVGDHVRMFAPNPQQSGSSVAHWDVALSPNQIMEPSYTGAQHNPALELELFRDIGWTLLTAAVYPSAPSNVTAVAGNSNISVSFTPGAIGSGSFVTHWAACSRDNGVTLVWGSGSGSPVLVSSLTNGQTYTCRVLTRSTVGDGPLSYASNSVVVGTAGVPTSVSATAQPGGIRVNFVAPVSVGAGITGYTVTCSANGQTTRTSTGVAPPITVSGLTIGVAYSCSVTSNTSYGSSAASAPASATVTVRAIDLTPILMLLLD